MFHSTFCIKAAFDHRVKALIIMFIFSEDSVRNEIGELDQPGCARVQKHGNIRGRHWQPLKILDSQKS